VLNFLREQNKGAHNMRTFEIPATGAFQLATRSEEHLAWFAEGREIACFETSHELMSQVAYYLEHDTERDQIAQAGHRCLEEGHHTYADRMKQVLDEVARL
jgi:spore maturation protein CgeB